MSGKRQYKAMEDVEEYHPDPVEKLDGEEEKLKRPNIRSALDLQRLKVEKLMKNPTKEIIIPEIHKEKDYLQSVPSFVRNVMGSSAGAGSGEFHVYRHLRRKEYARQKYIKAKSIREQLDDDYREKLERNKTMAVEKTAKKREKRQKKKLKQKQLGKKPKIQNEDLPKEDFSSDDTQSDDSAGNDQNIDKETTCEKLGTNEPKNLSNCTLGENVEENKDSKEENVEKNKDSKEETVDENKDSKEETVDENKNNKSETDCTGGDDDQIQSNFNKDENVITVDPEEKESDDRIHKSEEEKQNINTNNIIETNENPKTDTEISEIKNINNCEYESNH